MPRHASDSPPKPGRIRRICLLIPLLAIGVIAPTACYYEDFGYGAAPLPAPVYGSNYTGVPAAIPYGAYAPSVVSPFGIDHLYGARPYGGFQNYGARQFGGFQNPYFGYHPYGRSPNLYHEGHQRDHHDNRDQANRQVQAARQQEQSNERRRESQKEGWQYEDRNERRRKGTEESHEERKGR